MIRHQHAARVLLFAAVSCLPRTAAAQQQASPVHLAGGAVGAIGIPGPLVALRFSTIGARLGFDVEWGSLKAGAGDDRFVSGQLRILTRRRIEDGQSVSILIGANSREAISRTEIRWSDTYRTVTETRQSGLAGQFGVGFDSLRGRSRIGLDLVMGVNEAAGPRIFAKVFVVWGGIVRVE